MELQTGSPKSGKSRFQKWCYFIIPSSSSSLVGVVLGLRNWRSCTRSNEMAHFWNTRFSTFGALLWTPFWLKTKISQTALKQMKFNHNIHLTSPIMLEWLKLARTSDILWNRPPGHLELPYRRHYNREWLDKHFGQTFWTNILDKHLFITAGLHPAFHHGWFAPMPRVVQRKLCHVRCSA